MKTFVLCLLALLLFHTTSDALECEKAWLNPTVFRMCETEKVLLQANALKIKNMEDEFMKVVFEDAAKLNLAEDLKRALASEKKSPGESFTINKFLNRNKETLDRINWERYQHDISAKEMETIMNSFFESNGPKKPILSIRRDNQKRIIQ
jgi:hypothetical protein